MIKAITIRYLPESDPTRRYLSASTENGQFVTLVVTNHVILLQVQDSCDYCRRWWNWRLLSPWTTSPGEACNERWIISTITIEIATPPARGQLWRASLLACFVYCFHYNEDVLYPWRNFYISAFYTRELFTKSHI